MQKNGAEVQQMKERIQPVMKDIESRLMKLEKPSEMPHTEKQIKVLKDKFRSVMQDIERRLIALESRPIESALSNVSLQTIRHHGNDYINRTNPGVRIEGEQFRAITFDATVINFIYAIGTT